jgi:hypothetical protein
VRRVVLAVSAVLALLMMSTPAIAAVDAPNKGETVVSFTFDGTYKGQEKAGEILSDNGLAGTFYVNSGYIGYPAYLSLDQLRSLARNRNEIGGASLYGNDLSELSEKRARTEVCNDRTTLAQLGFQVTSFSYPHGASTQGAKAVAQYCGYNSARDIAGLYQSPTVCDSCPKGEPLPPTDDFRIRTSDAGATIEEMKEDVLRAENAGGGWVPLVFTYVCVCPDKEDAITPAEFTELVTWMRERPSTTKVKTVDQVMGGPLKPVVGKPLERLVPDPSGAIGSSEALSKVPAWTLFGVGIGQAQILFIGITLTIAIVLTYRIATRRDRHVG